MSKTESEQSSEFLRASLKINAPGRNYTKTDRYRDFRKVFFGSKEGERVFHQLLAWGHMFHPSFPRAGEINPYRMAIHEGERNMALKLLGVATKEPDEPPAQVNRKKETS